MKILLFGASGRLGGACVRGLSDQTLITPSRAHVDLNNESSVLTYIDSVHPDLVINATAYNQVDAAESVEGRLLAKQMNVEIPDRLARVCAERDIPFIHFSTDYVFDGLKTDGYRETDVPHPINA